MFWKKATITYGNPQKVKIIQVETRYSTKWNVIEFSDGMRMIIAGMYGYEGEEFSVKKKYKNGKLDGVATRW